MNDEPTAERLTEADRAKMAEAYHHRYEFEYDECDHGTYSGGPSHGEPYAMCERAFGEWSILTKAVESILADRLASARVQWEKETRDENAELLAQVERLQYRLIKAEEPRPQQPIDDFGGNIRSMYIRVSDGWLRRFDKWRKSKGLSRSGAIRKLVQDAWDGDSA